MKTFKIGKEKETGRLLDITEVKAGRDCNCVCPSCGEDLVAAHGDKMPWHFRHLDQNDCVTGYQEGLFQKAKQLISESNTLFIPQKGPIRYKRVLSKHKPPKLDFTPDLVVYTADSSFYVLIQVYEDKRTESDDFASSFTHNTLQIDLTDYVYESGEEFKKYILEDMDSKKILFWETKEEEPTPFESVITKKNIPWLAGIVGAGLALGLVVLFRNKAES